MIMTFVYFLLALIILITVHEFGHFWVARLCGVKVLRFSLGFGKTLFKWHDKKGTEYAISVIPLGGYVKMLDESEGRVQDSELHQAFNRQSLTRRVLIVLAGPVFNLLFAFVAIWLMLVIGVQSMAPIIESVSPSSIAQRAGVQGMQEIVGLANKPINSWRQFQFAAMALIGSDQVVPLVVKPVGGTHTTRHQLDLSQWQMDEKRPDILKSLGFKPFVPAIAPVVGEVHEGLPAYEAGIMAGDVIVKAQGRAIDDWLDLVQLIQASPNQLVQIELRRGKKIKSVNLMPKRVEREGQSVGFVGLTSKRPDWPSNWLREQRHSLWGAIIPAFKQTGELTYSTTVLLGRFISGKLSVKTISGPIGIAQGAGQSGRSGFSAYLSFLALVSISLAVLNLLPIPMLDGGHLVYYLVEFVRGKPVSEQAKAVGFNIGLLLLLALMIVAMVNDVSRLVG